MMTMLLLTGAAVMTGAAAGTALLRARAQAWGLMDVPNARSLHTRVTPRGGGIVVVLGVFLGLAVITLGGATPAWSAAAYVSAALAVAAIGWWDDVRSIPAARRFLTHLAAALAAVAVWGTLDRLQSPGLGDVTVPAVVAFVVTVLWIVGLLNAYNFMDGIDGLASGQAIVGGAAWVLLAGTDVPLVTAIAGLIAGASLGFLWHNWSPARIFMGDAGSGFLGFSFAVLPLIAYAATGDRRFPVAGLLVVAPFVFDAVYTFGRRLLGGENVIEAHRTHLYQRLVTGGWSHSAVTTVYLVLAAVSGGAAVAWMRGAPDWILAGPVALVVLVPPLLVARATSNR